MSTRDIQEEKATSQQESNCNDENEMLILSLPSKVQRFIHLYITGQYTLSALSDLLEVHPNTLGNWLRKEEVKKVISEMQETTHDVVNTQLKAMSLKAMNKLNQLLDSPIDGVALQAVKDVLDRGGHKPKTEIKVDKTVTTIEQKLSQLIEQTLEGEFEEVANE